MLPRLPSDKHHPAVGAEGRSRWHELTAMWTAQGGCTLTSGSGALLHGRSRLWKRACLLLLSLLRFSLLSPVLRLFSVTHEASTFLELPSSIFRSRTSEFQAHQHHSS